MRGQGGDLEANRRAKARLFASKSSEINSKVSRCRIA
jgi:hypothetical protein